MNILKLARQDTERTERSDRVWFKVDPNEIYPAAVAYIQQQLAEGRQGDGVIAATYYPDAAALPARAWELALVPRSEVSDKEVTIRADALEVARKWFTELLHRALRWQAMGVKDEKFWRTEPPREVGVPLGLYIEKDEKWRL